MTDAGYIWSVGRRKTAVARVRLYPGSGYSAPRAALKVALGRIARAIFSGSGR